MLPSTGHFKGFPCPFLESGLCERPYCHFKHVRRETSGRGPLRPTGPGPGFEVPSRPTYNPTPIAELKRAAAADGSGEGSTRRHIPVPYTPYRPSVPSRRPRTESYVPVPIPTADSPLVPSSEYRPGGVASADLPYSPTSSGAPPSLRYTPTPLRRDSPALSGDDEPEAKKTKRDRDPVVDIDGLEPEFEILGRIVDDERDSSRRKRDDSKVSSSRRVPSSEGTDRSEKSDSKSRERSSSKKNPSRDRESEAKGASGSRPSEDEKSSRRRDSRSKSDRDRSKRSNRTSSDGSGSKSKGGRSSERRKNGERDGRKREGDRSAKRAKDSRSGRSPEVAIVEDSPIEICIESSESDVERIDEECRKIFEEYVPAPKEALEPKDDGKREIEPDETLPNGKKRVAHSTEAPPKRLPRAAPAPNHKTKAIQMVADRYGKVKQFHEARLGATESGSNSTMRIPPPGNSSSKVRIAHVPYASNLLNAKKNLAKPVQAPKVTAVQTVAKGASRIAHVPDEKFCDRPGVLEPLASKIAVNVRTKFLNMMIDECLKIYLTAEDAYERALREELATSKKCSAIPIYRNSAVLTITRLRKEIQEMGGNKKSGDGSGAISHDRVLAGKLNKTSWSIENKFKRENVVSSEFKGIKFYENIHRWVLSEEELRDNGFPRPHAEKGRAVIHAKNTKQKPPKGNLRTCSRCKKEYKVDKKGFAVVKEECIYHPNNKYRYRGEVKYQCCSQDASSDGCLSAGCHVYDYVDYDNLRGFVKTLPKDDSDENVDHGVYALDCEMCYTTNGLDLTRVTVIDSSCKVVYESLVKPLYPIIDYNTKFSGLTEESMSDCTTTLLEVQATFLHMFSDKTILVGHSLESDFKALKLLHDTVVDTSVLFPHKMGPPYKRALRNLASEYLKKIIQDSVEGHDSAEDALVCMELLIWKLKEELKIR